VRHQSDGHHSNTPPPSPPPLALPPQVLACHVLIASRVKASVEEAAERLNKLLGDDTDFPAALMALAAAHMVLGQQPKARNLAKRVLKLPFDADAVDEWVAAHLLLADIHIEAGKYDQASEELKGALELDASCARAHEYLGAIAEKEVRYAEAAECYERAWRQESEMSAPVAYKLAFNYLKAGRYVAAIDVCHRILAQFPEYGKIRSEVLDKARAMLRN
jgi:tetratricopeptide repeat protein 21B